MTDRRDPLPSEITPEGLYLRRREFMRQGALFLGTASAFGAGLLYLTRAGNGTPPSPGPSPDPFPSGSAPASPFHLPDPPTSYEDITHYNNFYEFGLSKLDPAANAHTLKPRPWTIEVSGAVEKPLTLDLDTITKWFALEERVYRLRCVEAWSMVIPWLGFPLRALIEKVKPSSSAKFVAFQTLLDEKQMPLTTERVLEWPYVEGLRIDEATHPLTLLAVGLYGKSLPNQNGAPIRLVVPWKYGFKSIKSIVKLHFSETRPVTTWSRIAPKSYGFYANVNPKVSHPRWSQTSERRIGELERRATLPFNGYAPEVASLYQGMDLEREF